MGLRSIDRVCGWLMLCLSVAQLVLTLSRVRDNPDAFLGVLSTAVAEMLLAACNLLRAERPHDVTLARVCVFGNLAWVLLMLAFLITLPAPLVPALQIAVTLILLGLSLRTLRRGRPL